MNSTLAGRRRNSVNDLVVRDSVLISAVRRRRRSRSLRHCQRVQKVQPLSIYFWLSTDTPALMYWSLITLR